MSERPTQEEYNQLISQLGGTDAGQGPDILAVHSRERQPDSAAETADQPQVSSAVQPRQQAQRPEHRVSQYSRYAPRRAAAGQASSAVGARYAMRSGHPAGQQAAFRAAAAQQPGSAPAMGQGAGGSGASGGSNGGGGKAHRGGRRGGKGGFSKAAWTRAVVICLAMVGFAVAVALFALGSANDLLGLNQQDKQVEVDIDEGMSSGQVINKLRELGVIDKKLAFSLYASIKGATSKFRPGKYVMNCNFSYDEIIIMLKTGTASESNDSVVTITFYEGMSAWEIANKLEENKVCSAKDFINEVDTGDFSDYAFMAQIPEEKLRFVRLEGFLFPDTYDFYEDENPNSVVRRFLDNFQRKVTDDVISKFNNQNMTLYEGITLASIIQDEASKTSEMNKVSSVFHNRLSNSSTYPRLESDVTRDYIKNNITPHVDIVNEDMNAAYDTYQCTGLPVGPVDNPGLDAILAAAEPEDTQYYFFVTDSDGNYYYAKTFDEHVVNVNKAAKAGKAHGVAVEENK